MRKHLKKNPSLHFFIIFQEKSMNTIVSFFAHLCNTHPFIHTSKLNGKMQYFCVQIPFSYIPEFEYGCPHPNLFVKTHTFSVMVVREQGS